MFYFRLMVLVVAGQIVATVRRQLELNSNAKEVCWFVQRDKWNYLVRVSWKHKNTTNPLRSLLVRSVCRVGLNMASCF